MKNYNIITATAQGVYSPDEKGELRLQRYERSYQSLSDYKPFHILQTSKNIDNIHLNFIQRSMYRRLMYGLKEFTPEQIETFSPEILHLIKKDYSMAQKYLHILKAKKYYNAETKLMNSIFPSYDLGKKDYDWEIEIPKNVTLKSLRITTLDVIAEFIKRKLLPSDFLELTPENVEI